MACTKSYILLLLLFVPIFVFAQKTPNPPRLATIAFYNVENLYDTINSVDSIDRWLAYENPVRRVAIPKASLQRRVLFYDTKDENFTSHGILQWNSERYQTKLSHLAEVIGQIGVKETQQAPTIIGLAEVENKSVLKNLITQSSLKTLDYGIIHFDSPDERGIDVALLYQKSRFRPWIALPIELVLLDENGVRDYSRDILMVKGWLDGELFCFFVVHFPSRRGGKAKTRALREKAATLCKKYIDSVQQADSQIKIVLMGDFNDNPNGASIASILEGNLTSLYNPYRELFKGGERTLMYRNRWYLFDQILVSKNFVEKPKPASYSLQQSFVFRQPFMLRPHPKVKNHPWRTFAGIVYDGGYSDHLPVYMVLQQQ